MITIYNAEETDFSHTGWGVLSDIINPVVVEELNGQFYMEFQYLPNGNGFKELQVDRIIRADASPRLRKQLFRIVRINRVGKDLTTVHAEHVSNYTRQLQLKSDFVFSGGAAPALKRWADEIVVDHPFTTNSDIKETGEVDVPFESADNAREVLGGTEGSILSAYGGEYLFDNYRISLLKKRGWDRGVSISYGKNLIDVDQEDEIATVATTLFPYARYTPKRELVDKDDPNKDSSDKIADPEEIFVTLPEKIIDCENVEKFARRNVAKKSFNSELSDFFDTLSEKYDYSDREIIKEEIIKKLREVAIAYMEIHSFGIPNVSLRVEYVDLARTLEYKKRAGAEDVGIGDWITVEFVKVGISQRAQVTASRYDPQSKRYLSLGIGEMRMNLTQKINHEIVDLTGKYEGLDEEITIVQSTADGKNKIFRGAAEPKDNLKNGDLWYKPVGEGEVELYMYEDGQWILIVHSGMSEEVEQALKETEQRVEDARERTEELEKDANSILDGLGVETVGAIHQELSDSIHSQVGARINRVTDTTQLYERVIGSSESGIKNNVARIVMSDSIFRRDVSNEISGLSSSVTQLEGSWALRINSNDDLVTAINASERGVHIKGKDITFDGQVYSKGDFTVTGEMISDTIRANKIYGGVLNAATMKVINLDADSISTGSLRGVSIYGGHNDGFHVPWNADGVYNDFVRPGVARGARWKHTDHHYILQSKDGVSLFMGGTDGSGTRISTVNFAVAPDGHTRMRLSGRAMLKGLKSSSLLQVRNTSDTDYAPMTASDFVTMTTSPRTTTFMGVAETLGDMVEGRPISMPARSKLDIVKKTPVQKTDNALPVMTARFSGLETFNDPVGTRFGFDVKSAPIELKTRSREGSEGISLINTVGILWGAVQELSNQVEHLKEELNHE